MKSLQRSPTPPRTAPEYTVLEIGTASTLMVAAIVAFMVALSYPVTVAVILVGMLAGLVGGRAPLPHGRQPRREALTAISSQLGRHFERIRLSVWRA